MNRKFLKVQQKLDAYKDKFAKLPPLGACGGNKTQNSLPLFEKSCPIAALANKNPKMNINNFIYEDSARIKIDLYQLFNKYKCTEKR